MNKSTTTFAAAGVVFLVLIMCAMSSWFQVDQGERGVVLRNGKLVGIAAPGLGFKVPFIDSVKTVSVREHTFTFDKLEAYSYDQQPATLRVSVTYRVPEARVDDLYSEYGTLENLQSRVLERRTFDAVKNVFGKFTAVSAIQNREKLGVDVNTAVRTSMGETPVVIAGVQIEEVGFSTAYEQSIEQRMLAQVQIETTRQQKDTAVINAEIQVLRAQADADALRAQFTAEADGIKLRGEAEATAIRARAEALATNTNLVNLNAIDKWDGKLPTTQIPGAAMPFVGIK
ncbi:prohibitin family protein [Pigmentiphaga aceris]|uniref:Prohibitin family protein n=2 Tax=Pigmentiphaga aceris TaxID=1940612 RepID=A0A5C0AWP2_9BURK|nr:prohibitin family protein [Pigmentiphaga aceris]QEI06074.1 prohibitin family protein [Pigmentiphaga aceris]